VLKSCVCFGFVHDICLVADGMAAYACSRITVAVVNGIGLQSFYEPFLDQELISYRYSSCCFCCWDDLFKKAKAQSFQIRSGWNLAGLFFK